MKNTWDPDLYAKAWNFATLAHQGQTYGGPAKGLSVDYINHVGNVTMEVMWALPEHPDYDADLAVQCALLHDVIEDTVHTYEEVLEEFGQAVADGVLALTKDETLPTKRAQMEDSLARILQQPREVWMVKMADRITNLRYPPHYWSDEKIRGYRVEAQMIHDELHRASEVLAERFRQKLADYERFFQTQED